MYQFEVHTKTKMYSIMAAYFVANQDGVMFFDSERKGIGFAPNDNLELVKLTPSTINPAELMRAHNNIFFKTNKDD